MRTEAAGPSEADWRRPAGTSATEDRLQALNRLLALLWKSNPFYRARWERAGLSPCELSSLDELGAFPPTSRLDIIADQRRNPPLGTNRTFPASDYRRIHRSSGTSGASVAWADTPESWDWLLDRSAALFRLAGVASSDRAYLALPFGASLGPWVVHEGAQRLGCAVITAGRCEPLEEMVWFLKSGATVLVGKPARLASLARALADEGLDSTALGIHKLILTGDPGWSSRRMRREVEDLWSTEVFERYGLTEGGSVAGECAAHPGGLHVQEDAYIAEVVHPQTGDALPDGELGELVLTALGRAASPIVRYRTGDLVRLERAHHCPCGLQGVLLRGGIRRQSMRDSILEASPKSVKEGLP